VIITAVQTRDLSLIQLCQQANAALNEGLRAGPEQQAEPIARAERTVNRIRDALIEQLRRRQAEEDMSAQRRNLDEVNISLSLMAGVEFPAGAIHKKKLRQARKVLKQVERSLAEAGEAEG